MFAVINEMQTENPDRFKIEKNPKNDSYYITTKRSSLTIEQRLSTGYYIKGFGKTYLLNVTDSIKEMASKLIGDDVRSFQFLLTLAILLRDIINKDKYITILEIIKKYTEKEYDKTQTDILTQALGDLIEKLFTEPEIALVNKTAEEQRAQEVAAYSK